MKCHRFLTAALAPTVGTSVYEPHDAPHQSPHHLACRRASKPTPERHMSLATDQVALLKDAYRKVLLGQSVRYGERQVTRADAKWISDELDKWLRRAAAEAAPPRVAPFALPLPTSAETAAETHHDHRPRACNASLPPSTAASSSLPQPGLPPVPRAASKPLPTDRPMKRPKKPTCAKPPATLAAATPS